MRIPNSTGTISLAAAVAISSTVLLFLGSISAARTAEHRDPASLSYLRPGRVHKGLLRSGQTDRFVVAAKAGELVEIRINQIGLDLVVRIGGGTGTGSLEFDAEPRVPGVEHVVSIAARDGDQLVEIFPRYLTEKPRPYSIVLSGVRTASERERSIFESFRLVREATDLRRSGAFTEAVAAAERSFALREELFGPDDPETAAALKILGELYYKAGDFEKSRQATRRAVDLYSKSLPADDLRLVEAVENESIGHRLRGEFAVAEAGFRRVLEIRQKLLGDDHATLAGPLNELGVIARARGDNQQALQLYNRSLAIREKQLGVDHPDVVLVLQSLGGLYYATGDDDAVIRVHERSLAIREKHLDPIHPDLATTLTNLGIIYGDVGEYKKAELAHRRALLIRETRLGPENRSTVMSIFALATLYFQSDQPAKAEPLFARAWRSIEKQSSTEPPLVVASYALTFGTFSTFVGNYERAGELLGQALAIREKLLGPENLDVGRVYDALARNFALKGDIDRSLEMQRRANRIFESRLAENLTTGSERQRLAFSANLLAGFNQTLSIHADFAPLRADSLDEAVTAVLNRKGRVLEIMSTNSATEAARDAAETERLELELRDIDAKLSALAMTEARTSQSASHERLRERFNEMGSRRESVENELSLLKVRSGREASTRTPGEVKLEAVRAAIPERAALVEISMYRPFGKGVRSGEPCYLIYVLRSSGDVRWTKLGDAKAIDETAERFRRALRSARNADYRAAARRFDQMVTEPIRRLAGDVGHLLISPDGALSQVPFEAALDPEGRPLIERYAVTYFTSGRDLLRIETEDNTQSTPDGRRGPALIVAAPDFGAPPSSSAASQLGYFAPLPGTLKEADAVRAAFPNAVVLRGERASEEALRNARSPVLLHVATHGFFRKESAISSADRPKTGPAAGRRWDGKSFLGVEDALTRSGLALAGANRRGSPTAAKNDGILTALEASGLDLRGTKLVVLSACDTGIGEIKNGEGVFGLRRAFTIAGAETLVLTLWPISDLNTQNLIADFYDNLKSGFGRGEALRRAQLSMMRRPGRSHPFYWAGFIQSGDWTPIDTSR